MFSPQIKIPPKRRLDSLPDRQSDPFIVRGPSSKDGDPCFRYETVRLYDTPVESRLRLGVDKIGIVQFEPITHSTNHFRICIPIYDHSDVIGKTTGGLQWHIDEFDGDHFGKQLQEFAGQQAKSGMIGFWTYHAFERHRPPSLHDSSVVVRSFPLASLALQLRPHAQRLL